MSLRFSLRDRPLERLAQVLVLLSSAPLVLTAQQRPNADSARADSARQAARLAPVVVTVLRTPLTLLRAPYAVSVVDRDAVQGARPGLAVDEALRGVPGVQVDNRFNAALGERISVRGFGARTQFGVRGVKVLVDGVPATMPDGQTTLNHVDLGTLGRAEVARGPASALYGNAAGGVVQLETEPPPDSAIGETVRAVAGSDGLSRLGSTTGGRNGDGEWLVGVSRLRYTGFRQWSDQQSTRASARAGVGRAERALGNLRASGAWVDYDAHNPGALSDSLFRAAPTRAFANNLKQQTGETGHHAQLGIAWRRTLGAGEVAASAYALRRRLENPIPVSIVALDRRAGGGRVSFTAAHAAPLDGSSPMLGSARLTVGGELQRQRDDRQNFGNASGVRGARTLDQLEHVGSRALFAQGDASLGGRVVLLGGVRHERVRFAAADRLVTATNPDDSGERTLTATTPSLGASLALGHAASVYANASSSFETPTTTEMANRPTGAGGFNPDLRPQRARAIEGGVKGGLALGARGAATWQLAVYDTHLRDALVPFEVPGAPGRQFYRNAGRARHRGAEASADASLGAGIALRAAYTLVDARFTEYTVRDTSYAGRRIPGVAPQRIDVGLSWRGPRGALLAADVRAQNRMPATDGNRAQAAGYLLADLRAGTGTLRAAGVALAPFAGVTNVFDVRYATAVTVNAAGARYFEPGAGRSVYLGADLTLGRR